MGPRPFHSVLLFLGHEVSHLLCHLLPATAIHHAHWKPKTSLPYLTKVGHYITLQRLSVSFKGKNQNLHGGLQPLSIFIFCLSAQLISPVTLVSLLFPKHTRSTPTPGPLHGLHLESPSCVYLLDPFPQQSGIFPKSHHQRKTFLSRHSPTLFCFSP